MTPPKTRFTRNKIIDEAFNLVEENGINSLSARNVAKKLKMSPAPIYNTFKTMEELSDEVIRKTRTLLISYIKEPYTERIFLNIGTGIILFARDHPNLYKAIFVEGNQYKKVVETLIKELEVQMAKDPRFTEMKKADRSALLKRMWIFTHGYASLVFAGLIEKSSKEEIIAALTDIGKIVITAALSRQANQAKPIK